MDDDDMLTYLQELDRDEIYKALTCKSQSRILSNHSE